MKTYLLTVDESQEEVILALIKALNIEFEVYEGSDSLSLVEEKKVRYQSLKSDRSELPEWQKKIIDERLKDVEENPDKLRPIDELLRDLDSDS